MIQFNFDDVFLEKVWVEIHIYADGNFKNHVFWSTNILLDRLYGGMRGH